MGELVEAAKALSAPATKLIEVVSRGIGRAYDPIYKKKMADAAAYEIEAVSGAVRRNSDLPILFDREGILLDARSVQELAERTQMRLLTQEMRKQQNIEAIVEKAYKEIETLAEVSSEPVDDDWIVRFFNSVEDISDEAMRTLWGKILAGETTKPNSFSPRTLNVIKNVSKEEAELFQDIMSFAVEFNGEIMLMYDYRSSKNYNTPYDVLRTLNECRLIDLMSIMNRKFKLAPNRFIHLETEELWINISSKSDKDEEFNFTYLPLTTSGKEMNKVIRKQTNILGIMDLLRNQNFKQEITRIEAYKIKTDEQGRKNVNASENIFSWS